MELLNLHHGPKWGYPCLQRTAETSERQVVGLHGLTHLLTFHFVRQEPVNIREWQHAGVVFLSIVRRVEANGGAGARGRPRHRG